MPELRHDPLAGRWSIVAPERGKRSQDQDRAGCPFCPGHEVETPPASAVNPDRGAWRQRAFPNRFPLATGGRTKTGPSAAPSVGVHEVVVLTADHDRPFRELGDDEAIEVVDFLRQRVAAAEGQARNVVAFINAGTGAGASRVHPHAQIVGLDVAFPAVEAERPHLHVAGECPLCREVRRHRMPTEVRRSRAGSCWVPSWASCDYELLVAPQRHRARFSDPRNDGGLALLLRDALRAVDVVAGGPDVIVAIHSAPAGVRSFHWHVHVWPRLATAGGFELGSGLGVATVEPETAAAELRAALSGSAPIDVEPAPLLLR